MTRYHTHADSSLTPQKVHLKEIFLRRARPFRHPRLRRSSEVLFTIKVARSRFVLWPGQSVTLQPTETL